MLKNSMNSIALPIALLVLGGAILALTAAPCVAASRIEHQLELSAAVIQLGDTLTITDTIANTGTRHLSRVAVLILTDPDGDPLAVFRTQIDLEPARRLATPSSIVSPASQ
jgi:hypothetical protein